MRKKFLYTAVGAVLLTAFTISLRVKAQTLPGTAFTGNPFSNSAAVLRPTPIATPPTTPYHNLSARYHLNMPQGWRTNTIINPDDTLTLANPIFVGSEADKYSIDITPFHKQSRVSLLDFITANDRHNQEAVGETIIPSNGKAGTIHGKPSYTRDVKIAGWTATETYIDLGQKVIEISAKNDSKYRPVFDSVSSSVTTDEQ